MISACSKQVRERYMRGSLALGADIQQGLRRETQALVIYEGVLLLVNALVVSALRTCLTAAERTLLRTWLRTCLSSLCHIL